MTDYQPIARPEYLPFRIRCFCGRRFWGLRPQIHCAVPEGRFERYSRYERHYRTAHR